MNKQTDKNLFHDDYKWVEDYLHSDVYENDTMDVIKTGKNRIIFRWNTLQQPLVVKLFIAEKNIRSNIKTFILNSQAHREWSICNQVYQQGVPCVNPVSLLQQPPDLLIKVLRSKDILEKNVSIDDVELFLMKDETNFVSLDKYILNRIDSGESELVPQKLIRSLSELFSLSHKKGFFHRDGHAGNILISEDNNNFHCKWADLLGASFYDEPLSLEKSAESLAHFFHFFQFCTRRFTRLRFLFLYIKQRQIQSSDSDNKFSNPKSARDFLNTLFKTTREQADNLARKRDKRIGGNNNYFGVFEYENAKITYVKSFGRAHVPALRKRKGISVETWKKFVNNIESVFDNNSIKTKTLIINDEKHEPEFLSAGIDSKFFNELSTELNSDSNAWDYFVSEHKKLHRNKNANILFGIIQWTNDAKKSDLIIQSRNKAEFFLQ